MSTDKTFKIEPLNDELIEAIDVEIWSPEQPKWFIDWFSNKSDAESILNLDEIDWNLIDSGNRVNVPFNDNNVYSEVRYSKDFTTASTPFNRFVIKVVLRSQRSSRVPTLRDFRAIATT